MLHYLKGILHVANEIMTDLETLSLSNNAAIISIGAVRFDLSTGLLGETFYRVISLKSAQRAGGEIDADTVMWWLQQSQEAQKALTTGDSVLIDVGLKDFSDFVRRAPINGIWGNGAGFDNVVLENAYRRKQWTPPWLFHENRCYRTIAALFPHIKREQFRETGVHHNALSDAMTQARHICAIWRELRP